VNKSNLNFNSQKEVWEWLVSGGKVVNTYTSVIHFFKGGRCESGLSTEPDNTFSDYMNYEVFLE